MDALGLAALEARDLLGVEAELEQEVGLDAARELRVGDLVAPGAEVGRAVVYAQEEVGVAAPAVVEEGALVDDLGAGAHRGEGRPPPLRAPRLSGVDGISTTSLPASFSDWR